EVALHLDVDAARAEQLHQLAQGRLRPRLVAGGERPPHLALGAAAERDEAARVLGEERAADGGRHLAAAGSTEGLLQARPGEQAREVAVARAVLDEDEEARAARQGEIGPQDGAERPGAHPGGARLVVADGGAGR